MQCGNSSSISLKVEVKTTLDEAKTNGKMVTHVTQSTRDYTIPPPKKKILQGNMALRFKQYRHILDNLRIGHMNNQINTVQSGQTVCSIFIF